MPFVWRENKHSLHSFVYLSVRREQLQLFHQTSSKQDTCLKNQNWTRRCETKKLYERMAISHPPFRPFSHRDFHSKRLIPPKVLYLPCVRDKSENLKQQNPNGEFSKWWRCQERFQGHPLSDGPSPVRHAIAHLFCRLPALATCGEQRAAILIFVIHIYNRKDDLDLTSSGQSQWLTGCKRLWTVFLDRPVLNQMAAEMEKCCQLQALSPMHRSCSFRHCFSSIWFLFMNVLK